MTDEAGALVDNLEECDPEIEECVDPNYVHPFKIYEDANLSIGVISVFASVVPTFLWVFWRMPVGEPATTNMNANIYYYIGWMIMWIFHLVAWFPLCVYWGLGYFISSPIIALLYKYWMLYGIIYGNTIVGGSTSILLIVAIILYS